MRRSLLSMLGVALMLVALPAFADKSPTVASTKLVFSSGTPPQNETEQRLNQLEQLAEITRFTWEYQVPAGKKMIFHFVGGDTRKIPGAVWRNDTYEVTGPLSPSFGNRIVILRQFTNKDTQETVSFNLYTHTDKVQIQGFVSTNTTYNLDNISGGYSASPGTISGTEWNENLGTTDSPNLVYYQLDISIAPANPGTKPGQVVFIK